MPPFDPKPFGRYVLLEKLAIGGMAEIYKAKTFGVDGFEKLLAIKRILPHCSADKEFIHMLVDEAKLTVLLSHANIVQVYDLGKVGDDYFISMEYINGTNLRELMTRSEGHGKKLAEEIAVYIISEICKGLDYAHRKMDTDGHPLNIVHRDISPQNILISYEGEAKIVDFGIAKAALNVSHTMAGILKGKIAYMSPEQALGKPIDNRTDIFSTGVVLYELLTGEKLFQGDTQFEVLRKIRTTRINTIGLPEEIPGPLKAILVKALAYQPKDRYQTAGDFQLDLTKYLYSSYVDFSPRQLSTLLHKLFANELKERRKEPAPPLSEKTRSVIIKEAAKEEIVVKRDQGEPSLEKTHETPLQPTEVSTTLPSLTRKGLRPLFFGMGLLLLVALGFGGAFLYKRFTAPPTEEEVVIPPPPTLGVGTIQVVTNPPGATLFLDNRATELVTPATLSELDVGETYLIRVTKEQYRDLEKKVTLTSTQPLLLEESLTPLPLGVVEIVSTPPGVKILINNQEVGKETPTRVENLELNKAYVVKLVKDHYHDWTGSLEIQGFEPVKLEASLIPIPKVEPPPAPLPPLPAITTKLGEIEVRSTPAGAEILLNGKKTGQVTPTTLKELEAGKKYTITLLKEGYEKGSRTLTVEEGKATPLIASLKKIVTEPTTPLPPPVKEPEKPKPPPSVEEPKGGPPGSLAIKSDPSGAEVYINNEFKGKTPLKVDQISPGNVSVTVTKEGYMRYSSRIRLGPGESKSLGTIELGGSSGEVYITSSPPRARVIFDGDRVPNTPVKIKDVPRDRPHTVRVELEGYRSWETTFDMKAGTSKKFNVSLEKE